MSVQLTKQSIDLGIITTNGEAMLAFYRDTLGLRYLRELPMPIGTGVMHQMQCGEAVIKLVVLPAVPAFPAPGGIAGGAGYRYWTMTVSNLSEMVQACADKGYKIALAEREIRPGVRIAMVEDPDGNWVEFLSIG